MSSRVILLNAFPWEFLNKLELMIGTVKPDIEEMVEQAPNRTSWSDRNTILYRHDRQNRPDSITQSSTEFT